MPGTAGLGAANAAVAALVPILVVELRPRRVNGGKTPVGRAGKPDDIAQAIAFLITNTFLNGHMIVRDGGLGLAA